MVGTRFEIDPKHTVLVSACSAGDRAMEAHQRDGEPSAGESHPLGYFRDDPDARVRVVLSGHQEHAIVAAHVDRQRDRHAREHHGLVQGNDS